MVELLVLNLLFEIGEGGMIEIGNRNGDVYLPDI